jgi:hypothetical protein
MKHSLWLGALLFLGSASAYAAPDSCERVKNDIQQRIINNGVPEQTLRSPSNLTIKVARRCPGSLQ